MGWMGLRGYLGTAEIYSYVYILSLNFTEQFCSHVIEHYYPSGENQDEIVGTGNHPIFK